MKIAPFATDRARAIAAQALKDTAPPPGGEASKEAAEKGSVAPAGPSADEIRKNALMQIASNPRSSAVEQRFATVAVYRDYDGVRAAALDKLAKGVNAPLHVMLGRLGGETLPAMQEPENKLKLGGALLEAVAQAAPERGIGDVVNLMAMLGRREAAAGDEAAQRYIKNGGWSSSSVQSIRRDYMIAATALQGATLRWVAETPRGKKSAGLAALESSVASIGANMLEDATTKDSSRSAALIRQLLQEIVKRSHRPQVRTAAEDTSRLTKGGVSKKAFVQRVFRLLEQDVDAHTVGVLHAAANTLEQLPADAGESGKSWRAGLSDWLENVWPTAPNPTHPQEAGTEVPTHVAPDALALHSAKWVRGWVEVAAQTADGHRKEAETQVAAANTLLKTAVRRSIHGRLAVMGVGASLVGAALMGFSHHVPSHVILAATGAVGGIATLYGAISSLAVKFGAGVPAARQRVTDSLRARKEAQTVLQQSLSTKQAIDAYVRSLSPSQPDAQPGDADGATDRLAELGKLAAQATHASNTAV